MSLDIAEYLDGKGSAATLVRLDTENGLINSELESQLHITSSSLSNRLSEAMSLDLVEETRLAEDHGNATRYVLTKRGKEVVEELKELGVDESYERLFQADKEINQAKNEAKDWLKESIVTHPEYPPEGEPSERE